MPLFIGLGRVSARPFPLPNRPGVVRSLFQVRKQVRKRVVRETRVASLARVYGQLGGYAYAQTGSRYLGG